MDLELDSTSPERKRARRCGIDQGGILRARGKMRKVPSRRGFTIRQFTSPAGDQTSIGTRQLPGDTGKMLATMRSLLGTWGRKRPFQGINRTPKVRCSAVRREPRFRRFLIVKTEFLHPHLHIHVLRRQFLCPGCLTVARCCVALRDSK